MSHHDDANRKLAELLRAELPAARYSDRMTLFTPGRPLPADSASTQERTLYHAPRASGEMATMTREGGTWQWRQLRGSVADGYGTGGWNDMHQWLKVGPA